MLLWTLGSKYLSPCFQLFWVYYCFILNVCSSTHCCFRVRICCDAQDSPEVVQPSYLKPSETLAFIIWFWSEINIQPVLSHTLNAEKQEGERMVGRTRALDSERIPLESWSVILNIHGPCPVYLISMNISFPVNKTNSMHGIFTSLSIWKLTKIIYVSSWHCMWALSKCYFLNTLLILMSKVI